ncbi:sulfur reduction protein DsrJ [Halochromatium salexigens]|uniref:sulfur reduction protein DsrJ n=1 Tax=Halochromatium salexigens TaxID=49447 RepID=UPI00191335B3|nr:sulfur reduction protein DsrJ [Halochromatium salexigens]
MATVMMKGVLLASLVATFGMGVVAQAEEVGDYVLPSSKAASLENCVEPTEYMRRNHFELIRHQRDQTVYGGIRGSDHGISGCVSCHVGYDDKGAPVEIDGKGQFCQSCHEYAAVELNCFDCHATVPTGEAWNHEVAAAHAHLPGAAKTGPTSAER